MSISLSQKPAPDDDIHLQVALASADSMADEEAPGLFHPPVNAALQWFASLPSGGLVFTQGCESLTEAGLYDSMALSSRLAFQLFCHCNFTHNCGLTESL